MNGLTLNNKAYDVAKKVAQIWLPAFGAAYFSLAQIWGLPSAEQVVGTVTVIDTLLGVLLGISSSSYNNSDKPYDGQMIAINKPDGGKTFSLQLDSDPLELEGKEKVVFKVVPTQQNADFWKDS